MSDGVSGGGLLPVQPACDTGMETGMPTGDTGMTTEVTGGGGCHHGVAPGPWLILCVLLHMVFRSAVAADVQTLQVVGDDFVGLRTSEPLDAGATFWSVTGDVAVEPVVRRGEAGYRAPIIASATTLRMLGAVQLGSYVRLGLSAPVHRLSGEVEGWALGDVWAQVMLGSKDTPVAAVLEVERSHAGALAGYGQHAVVGGLTGRQGPFGWQALVRLQAGRSAFGVPLGSRFEAGAGVVHGFGRRLEGAVEVLGSMPLSVPRSSVDVPVELLPSARWSLGNGWSVRVAMGVGVTGGIGTPAFRALTTVQSRRNGPVDVDGDGLKTPRDLCPSKAEDQDGFRDGDGCPDVDNDRDGLLDVDDACPDRAEVVNGIADEDGCPDAPAGWTVMLEHPETAVIRQGGAPPVRLLKGESWSVELRAGEYVIDIQADGFVSQQLNRILTEGEHVIDRVGLERQRIGSVELNVQDANGAPLNGEVTVLGETAAVVEGRWAKRLPAGLAVLEVRIPGWAPVSTNLEVAASEVTVHTIVMERPAVWRSGHRIETATSELFEVDRARLIQAGVFDDLAAWLLAHPEVRLLRVEGHADAVGSSAYNFDLSVRRAEHAAGALIERGVESARLQVVGAGEASVGEGALRQVGYTVLVWEEE